TSATASATPGSPAELVFRLHGAGQDVANRGNGFRSSARFAPDGTNRARRHGLRELPYRESSLGPERRFHGGFGKQGNAETGDHHLPEGFEARGPEIFGLANVDTTAHFQGLVAEAVAVLQEQQSLALQVGYLDGGLGGERMVIGQRDGEG